MSAPDDLNAGGRGDEPRPDGELSPTGGEAPFATAADDELEMLWRHSVDILTVLDIDGRWRWSSPAGTRLLGHSAGYDPEGGFFSLVHPDDLGGMLTAYEELLAGTRSGAEAVECRVRTADGEWRWYETTGEVLLDDPLIAGVLLRSRDVTARRDAEDARRRATAQFESVFNDSPAGVVIVDGDGKVVRANAAIRTLLGAEDGTTIEGSDIRDWIADDGQDAVEERAERLRADGTLEPVQRQLVRTDGVHVTCQVAGAVLQDADPPAAVFHVTDLTATVAAQQRSAEAEARFTRAFNVAPVGMAILDGDGRFEDVNEQLVAILRCGRAQLIGANLTDFLATADDTTWGEHAGDSTVAVEHLLEVGEGTRRWCRISIGVVEEADGQRAVAYVEDIDDQLRDAETLAHKAVHDELTGLLNRVTLTETLARLEPSGGAVLFCDLDNFKTVNDTYGHDTGDLLLREVARRLTAAVRDTDIVARFGGDEFVIVCPDVDATQATRAAERILETLTRPVHLDDGTFAVMTSIGIAMREAGSTPTESLRDADTAMYAAKAQGRNCAVVFHPDMRDAALARHSAETRLRGALNNGQIVAAYQPIVSLHTGHIRGFECLARWSDPERGLVTPEEFLDVAESTGLVVDIDLVMLDAALDALAEWRRAGHADVSVSVNCSPRSLATGTYAAAVIDGLAARGLDAAHLYLEVTEGTLIGSDVATTETLTVLHRHGVSLAVDDFGTGYSGLAQLRTFPASMVKIDRQFVAGLGASVHDEAIVTAVLAMTDVLGLDACAEGVETAEQAEVLADRGCSYAQGYLYSAPVDATAAGVLLDAGVAARS